MDQAFANLFAQENLKKLVEQALPSDAKPGEKIVVGAVDLTGAQIVVSLKLHDLWEVQAAARYDWTGDASAGAKVILRWQ